MKSLELPKGGNQNLYIKEKQTTQWPKEKVQKDKQRSTNTNIIYFNTVNIKIHLLYVNKHNLDANIL
jgi:hypothetical protein